MVKEKKKDATISAPATKGTIVISEKNKKGE